MDDTAPRTRGRSRRLALTSPRLRPDLYPLRRLSASSVAGIGLLYPFFRGIGFIEILRLFGFVILGVTLIVITLGARWF